MSKVEFFVWSFLMILIVIFRNLFALNLWRLSHVSKGTFLLIYIWLFLFCLIVSQLSSLFLLIFKEKNLFVVIQFNYKHFQYDVPSRPCVYNLSCSIDWWWLNCNKFVNDVFHSKNMHILCESWENAVFKWKFIKTHQIICSLTTFGRLSVENNNFLKVFLWKHLIFKCQ